jgi:hypothetical protein
LSIGIDESPCLNFVQYQDFSYLVAIGFSPLKCLLVRLFSQVVFTHVAEWYCFLICFVFSFAYVQAIKLS